MDDTRRRLVSSITIALLAASLLAAIGIIIFQRHSEKNQVQTRKSVNVGTFEKASSAFFSALPNADQSTKNAHREFAAFLSTIDASKIPDDTQLKRLATGNPIPYDYEFFFKECLPAYRQDGRKGNVIKDPNIIVSLPPGASYKARLFVNIDNASVAELKKRVGLEQDGNRILFAGAYSSPFKLPAGLTISSGEVVNPVLQRFDGIVMIDGEGHIIITDIRDLREGWRVLDVRSRIRDYQQLLQLSREQHLSLFQGNLLISEGRVVTEERPSQAEVPRRVLFSTEDGGIHVYDSLKKPQTLFKTAKTINEKFHAVSAINLETGPNNLCQVKTGNKLVQYGEPQPGATVTNVIVIAY